MTCSEISRVCRHATMNFVTLFFLVMHNSKFVAVDEDDGTKGCVCVCVCVCGKGFGCGVERGLGVYVDACVETGLGGCGKGIWMSVF